ncbi:MAG: hypothetical protein SVW51_08330 [Pseudomonadota bacterium]|nr:hypothetical protein [Pseudomonadota bacterium]
MNKQHDNISRVEIERDTTDMLLGNSFVGLLMTIFAFSGLVFFFENDEPSVFTQAASVGCYGEYLHRPSYRCRLLAG